MTNKRQLKKRIALVAEEVAQTVLPMYFFANKITVDEVENDLVEISKLQAEAKARLSISFDKTPKDFDSPKAYHAARARYFKAAYAKALKEYEDGVVALINKH